MLVIAFITEAIWETAKLLKNPKGINVDKLGAMGIGVLIAVAGGIDIFQIVGSPLGVKYLGMILTGLLISRGSNFIHDILGSTSGIYQNTKNRQP